MSTLLSNEAPNTNEDPLSHEHGAHPIATGVGAVGGGATGAALGVAIGGPVGGLIGAVVGAVAGGLGGTALGEQISPTIEPGSIEPAESHIEPAIRTAQTIQAAPLPSHEAIAFRAWLLYEREGKPDGQDLRHWFIAEKELLEPAAA